LTNFQLPLEKFILKPFIIIFYLCMGKHKVVFWY